MENKKPRLRISMRYVRLAISLYIKSRIYMVRDYLFLKFNKDYIDMHSPEAKKRIKAYKDSTEELYERLSCNLLLYDAEYAASLINNDSFPYEEVRRAFGSMKEIKEKIKIR